MSDIKVEKNMITRKWVSKKTGEIVIKQYDNKIYYDTWYTKNKDRMNIKNTCEVCGGRYSNSNIACHTKTKKHLKALENKNI